MTKILALDIATNTGVAFSENVERGDDPPFESWDFKEYSVDYGWMAMEFRHRIHKACITYDIDVLAIEQPIIMNRKSAYMLNGMAFTAHFAARERHLPRMEFTPTEVKKAFTGRGKASKEDMIREAVKRGYAIRNSDEADAVAVMLLAKRMIDTGC